VDRLRQVLGNLISNAIRYSPGGGKVYVHARRSKGSVKVEVVDQGVGVPPEEVAHLFERYYRGSGRVASTERGAGLGLAIVKQLVAAHGGQVGVESTPGLGSTFWFTLPREASQASGPQPGEESPTAVSYRTPEGRQTS